MTDLRRHRLTGSRAADLMTGNYKVWNRLAWDMRSEQPILGQKRGIPPLDWGIDNEPRVRAWCWERHPEWEIERVEFQPYHDQTHPLFADHVGCSPDGLIRPDGWGLEVKAPYNPANQLAYCRAGILPDIYVPQVQWCLWATGWPRFVFASGDPRIEDDERYFEIVVEPDLAYHARLEELATEFLEGYLSHEEFRPRAMTAATLDSMF